MKNDDETSITESLIVDRSKIRRARKAFAEKKQKEKKKQETSEGIECIGTDGKMKPKENT